MGEGLVAYDGKEAEDEGIVNMLILAKIEGNGIRGGGGRRGEQRKQADEVDAAVGNADMKGSDHGSNFEGWILDDSKILEQELESMET